MSKSEYKNLSAAVKQRFEQRGRTNRHGSERVDSESDERQWLRGASMARAAHKLDACFPDAGDDDPDEYLFPLPSIEKSDDDCIRQGWSDTSAAEQAGPISVQTRCSNRAIRRGPSRFQILQHERNGTQAVGGRRGVRRAAGSVIAYEQAMARGQRVWLNCDDELILDDESASVTEESSGDKREGSLNRETENMCVWLVARDNHPVFSQQTSKSRAQGCRWTEVRLRSRRRGKRERRASVLTTDKQKDEYEVMRTVLRNWCNSCVRGRAKQSHRCPTSDRSRPSMAKDCRVSTRSVNENSPTVLMFFERTHGVERDCQVSHEATEPHAVDCVQVHLDACGLSEERGGNSERKSEVFVSVEWRDRGYCEKD